MVFNFIGFILINVVYAFILLFFLFLLKPLWRILKESADKNSLMHNYFLMNVVTFTATLLTISLLIFVIAKTFEI